MRESIAKSPKHDGEAEGRGIAGHKPVRGVGATEQPAEHPFVGPVRNGRLFAGEKTNGRPDAMDGRPKTATPFNVKPEPLLRAATYRDDDVSWPAMLD